MGTILTASSSKGGAGKTTLCIILAAGLAARSKVAVIDADRNQSFSAWYMNAYEGPTFDVHSEVDHIRIVDLAAGLAESHDLVLVDTAGFENLTAASAIGMADHVLIPCMADRGSVRETLRTAQQVSSLSKAARRPLPYSVILVRWKARGLAERVALESLREAGLNVMGQHLSDSADYAKLSFSGELAVNGKARAQAEMIIDELCGIGAMPHITKVSKGGKGSMRGMVS